MIHQNENVQTAIVRLNDAICEWNRATGRDVAVIVRDAGFTHRSLNGKPLTQDWVSDEDLLLQAGEVE